MELTKELRQTHPTVKPDILLVEDDPNDLELELRVIRAIPCDVTIARTGREAIAAYRQKTATDFVLQGRSPHPFDLVVVDLKLMPDMNGVAVMREIRKTWPDQPLIVVTGHLGQFDQAEMKEIGYKGLIEKPLVEANVHQILAAHNLAKPQRPSQKQ